MNLARLALGVLSIWGGVSALKRGTEHLKEGLGDGHLGLKTGSRSRPGVRSEVRNVNGRRLPKLIKQGKHQKTVQGPMRTTLREVNNLDDRLTVIVQLAREGRLNPKVIAWARKELSKKCGAGWNGEQWCVPEKNTEAEITAIFKALRRDVRYTSDVLGADTYAAPHMALQTGGEDCDGFAALGCAALMSVGIPCRFKVIQTKRSSTPDHIFIQGGASKDNPSKWISLDASVPMPPGWEAPASMVSKEWIYPVYPPG